jgi:hypothetical protein
MFPSALLEQADWIEGCYTPGYFKNEPKLVLGYHPNLPTIPIRVGENILKLQIKEQLIVKLPREKERPEGIGTPKGWGILRQQWQIAQKDRDFLGAFCVFNDLICDLVRKGILPKDTYSYWIWENNIVQRLYSINEVEIKLLRY